jgi:regulatory protein YycI of two-component signal transduction system YycFG
MILLLLLVGIILLHLYYKIQVEQELPQMQPARQESKVYTSVSLPKICQEIKKEVQRPRDADDKVKDMNLNFAKKNKQAVESRQRWNSDQFKAFIEEDLQKAEKRVWWEVDSLETL